MMTAIPMETHTCHADLDTLDVQTIDEDKTAPREARVPLPLLVRFPGGDSVVMRDPDREARDLKDLWLLSRLVQDYGL